jgi:hypothetical protein
LYGEYNGNLFAVIISLSLYLRLKITSQQVLLNFKPSKQDEEKNQQQHNMFWTAPQENKHK